MPKENLPNHVNPMRFAENAMHLHGSLLIKAMPRLCQDLPPQEGKVDVVMEFGIDQQDIRFVKGNVTAQISLICQRCLQPFVCVLNSRFLLGLVTTERQIQQLPACYESWEVKDDNLVIAELVEEELIISLPIVPMHKAEECNISLPTMVATEKANPFKLVESLKGKTGK